MFGEIKNSSGETLDYTFHPAGAGSNRRILVLGHGVTGNKDRPFLVSLAEGIAAAGAGVFRFSFAGNGASEGRFEESTISKEVGDLGAILDALDGYDICYAGHSMGGAVGVIRASEDSRIRWLVSLAGMVQTKAFAEREFGEETPGKGFMWDQKECPLSEAFMADMRTIGSVSDRARSIAVPWLLVHGKEDDVVPIEESREIYSKATTSKELVEIEGADHVFSGEKTDELVEVVVKGLRTFGFLV